MLMRLVFNGRCGTNELLFLLCSSPWVSKRLIPDTFSDFLSLSWENPFQLYCLFENSYLGISEFR